MATLEQRVVDLAQAIGGDIKALTLAQGPLTSLSTTAKSSLVAAINEVAAGGGGGGGATINDTAGAGATTVTWSADKLVAAIAAAQAAAVNSVTNGAAAALDTLSELAAALGNDANFATTIATALGLRVRVDAAQAFDGTQQAQARTNIAAASAASVTALSTALGDTDRNFVSVYTTAKA